MTKADAARAAALVAGTSRRRHPHRRRNRPGRRRGRGRPRTRTLLAELRGLWREALATADDDADAMIDLGRRWCETVGTDPDTERRTW